MVRGATYLRGRALALMLVGCAIFPDIGRAHNVGSGLFGHTLLVSVDPEEVTVDYMIEIPTSVLLKEFWEFLKQNEGASTSDKDRHITSIMLKRLSRGLLLICNETPVNLEEVEAVQEKTGFGDYAFFQYRVRLKGMIEAIHTSAKLTLVNRNYAGFRGVYVTSVSVTPQYKVEGCSLRNTEQRFILDAQTGQAWSFWEGHRSIEMRVRVPRFWEGVTSSTGHFMLDNRTVYEATKVSESHTASMSRSGNGDSVTGRIGRVLHQKDLSPKLVLFALAMAVVLGAAHALSPGHGKSLVAAYLVGTRGRARDAVLLGGIVTFSHVFSVILLGVLTLAASNYFVPEQMLPYLEVGSGALILLLGIFLLWKRWPRAHMHIATATHHRHAYVHRDQGGHSHPDGLDHGEKRDPLRIRELVILGLSGGIVPCPSAFVILLMALAINRLLFGLALVVAFSLGLAMVLITMGLVMVWAGSSFRGLREDTPLLGWLPVVSGFVIVIIGIIMVLRSVKEVGLLWS